MKKCLIVEEKADLLDEIIPILIDLSKGKYIIPENAYSILDLEYKVQTMRALKNIIIKYNEIK